MEVLCGRSRWVSLLAGAFVIIVAGALLTGLQSSAKAAESKVGLGTAGKFAVLAGTTVTNTGSSIIAGDLGVRPGSAVTGLAPGRMIGARHAADAVALQAQADLAAAYKDARRTPATRISGDLDGETLVPGIYHSASSLELTGTVTLDAQGDPDAVFIFQISSTFITASASEVVLTGGAQACNVFWQVGNSVTLGANSTFMGTVLALASISVTSGTTVDGRVLACNEQVSPTAIIKHDCASAPTATPMASSAGCPVAVPAGCPMVPSAGCPAAASAGCPMASPAGCPVAVPTGCPKATPVVSPTMATAVTPTKTHTVTPTVTPTVTSKASSSVCPLVAPPVCPNGSPAVTPKAAPMVIPKATPKVTPIVIPKETPKVAPMATPKVTPMATPMVIPKATPKATPKASPTMAPTVTRTPTPTPTHTVTRTPTPTVSPTVTRSVTPTSSATRIDLDPGHRHRHHHHHHCGHHHCRLEPAPVPIPVDTDLPVAG